MQERMLIAAIFGGIEKCKYVYSKGLVKYGISFQWYTVHQLRIRIKKKKNKNHMYM